MSGSTEPAYPQAVLNLSGQNGPLLTFAKAVYKALEDNAVTFVDPDPPLPQFLADIGAYEDGQTKAAGRGKGAAKARNAKKRKVRQDLRRVRDYVQVIAEGAETPDAAAAIITTAFLSVKKKGSRSKPELAAKYTGLPGEVLLVAKAVAPNAAYFFQYSVNLRDWVDVPETMTAKTLVTGLTPATVYHFRFRAISRKGRRDWSQIVSLLVH
jgi:hypothetical protein